MHNKPNSSAETFESLGRVIKNTECDLIVFLGDTVHGPSVKENYGMYLRQVLDLTKGVKFAFVFGNHDDECETSKEEILSVIGEYDNSLVNGRDYSVEMLGETLIFLDSGSYYNGKGSYYDTVKQEQIDFCKILL
ncbi:MAG: metallophosphoesterase [Clostridiales bacterium]|nr:metallophosphoesterase [Clostridiales bacterium]